MATRPGLIARMRRMLGDKAGNVAILGAVLLPVGIAAAAFAVDEGALYLERREAQSLTDLAAIVAAADLKNAEPAALGMFHDNRHPEAALANAGGEPFGMNADAASERIRVEKGRYEPDPGKAASERFVAGQEPANAVRVSFSQPGTRYFASRVLPAPTISTTAIASTPAEAAFSVGSRLASVNNGILNALLGKLLGANIALSVMDYNALIATDVSALGFLDALATKLNITAGTYSDVLAANASMKQVVDALLTVGSHNQQAKAALTAISKAIPANTTIKLPLSHLVDLGRIGSVGLGHGSAAMDASVGLMEMLGASAAIANGSNQIKLDTGLTIPGLLGATADLAIGEPPQNSPWFAIGETGKIVRTAQTRLRIVASVGGPGGLLGTSIRVPIYVELAYAEAKLKSITCPPGNPQGGHVSVAARPGVAELWLGEIDPAGMRTFTTKPVVQAAKLIQMPIVKVTGSAHTTMSNQFPTTLTFSRQEITSGVVKNVSTSDLTTSLTKSLFDDLTLNVTIDLGLLSIGIVAPSQSAVKSTVTTILGTVTAPLDTLLYNLLSALGVRVGEADVRVNGLTCGRSVLVN